MTRSPRLTTRAAGLLLVCVTATASHGVAAQTPRDPVSRPTSSEATTVIRGRVTRAEDGAPIHAAQIWLARDTSPLFGAPDEELPSATTDDKGRFELVGLTSGQYTVTAVKSGFVGLKYGQQSVEQLPQSLRIGSSTVLDDVDMALPRAGAVDGLVVDDRGEPVVGMPVRLLRREEVDGVFRTGAEVGVADRTGDDGRFRVYGAPPGRYLLAVGVHVNQVLSVAQRSEPRPGGRLTFYPGTTSPADALPVEVVAGGNASELVVSVRPTARAAVTGQVVTLEGQPVPAASVTVLTSGPDTMWMENTYRAKADGTFRAANLEPGTYALTASGPSGLQAKASVALDGVDADVRLVLGKTNIVRGRLTFGTLQLPPTTKGFEVATFPADGGDPGFYAVQDDWTFEVTGLTGAVEFVAHAPSGWTIDQIRNGATEVKGRVIELESADEPVLELRVTNRVTGVTGVVKDRQGKALGSVRVVVYTADPAKRKGGIHVAQANASGQFDIAELEPGRYFVAVADPAMFDHFGRDVQMAAILERLERSATSVTVREGQTETIEVSAGEM